MNPRIFLRWPTLCAFLFLAVPNFGAVVFTGMRPQWARSGETVELQGTGFAKDATLSLNGVALQIVSRAEGRIVFRAAAAAGSGLIVLTQGGSSHTNRYHFATTRALPGRLEIANPAGYEISGFIESVLNPDGTFVTEVPVDEPTLLWATKRDADPAFMIFVTPEMTEARITPRTTAEAVVLSTPGVQSETAAAFIEARKRLAARPETQQLADLVAAVSAAGRDYLDDARIADLWGRAVTALLADKPVPAPRAIAKDFEPGAPRGTRLKYINPPDGTAGNPDYRRLDATFKEIESATLENYVLKIEPNDRFFFQNPVDWMVELYELDPSQLVDGFNSVDALDYLSRPAKKWRFADDTAVVGAKLRSKQLDILDVAMGYVVDGLFGLTVGNLFSTEPDELAIRARPGVYVTEMYSGNLYWGSGFFPGAPLFQSQLIDDISGRWTHRFALGANILVAAVDIAGIFVPLKAFMSPPASPSDLQEVLFGVGQDVAKSIAIHDGHPMTTETIYDLMKSAASSFAKNGLAKLAETSPERYGRGNWTRRLKNLAKSLDVIAKVSAGLQAAERTTGLLHKSVLGIERSVVVIGNPFSPSITSFSPGAGRGGETLLIQGANFSTDTNLVKVMFATFAGTDDPERITHSFQIPVIGSTATAIVAYVPTNLIAEFPTRSAQIVVEVTGKPGRGTTAALNHPYREFFFIPPPAVSAVTSPTFMQGMIDIRGENFPIDQREQIRIEFNDGSWTTWPSSVSSNRMIAPLPFALSDGEYDLRVRLGSVLSQIIPVRIERPRHSIPTGAAAGYDITVTKPDMSNIPDGKISVLEAVLIASGQLGRPVETHLPCESLPADDPGACPRREREEDWIRNFEDFPNGGAATADRVTVHNVIERSEMAGVLPPLTSGDSFNFSNIIIDGGGAAQPGLVLDGATQTSVYGLTLRNFGGNGIELKNGASHNRIEFVRIENSGGNGLAMIGDAQFNSILGLSVSNAVANGILLSGANVTGNNIAASGGGHNIFTGDWNPYTRIEKAGGDGIRVENGAHHNQFVPGTIRENGGAGIRVTGETSDNNYFGRFSDELLRLYDVVKNGGPGVHLSSGVENTVFRYINSAGNNGPGFLLEGPNCANNQIDRPFIGVNRYEGGTDRTLPNQGSGIHLRDGAQHNLIGSRIISFGETGTICANRDDGILLEGANTAFNIINQQWIGMESIAYNPLRVSFFGNGGAGIRIRGGSHDNTIGDTKADLNNIFFDAKEAALVIEGVGTTRNLVVGNQFGSYFGSFSTQTGWNKVGIHIRDGADDNIIGQHGGRVQGGRFGPMFQFWNTINRSQEAGLLIERAGGRVGTDGVLSGANVVQGNKIGEEDTGNIARNVVGLKIGEGAHANIIGGATPAHGNRINGNNQFGVWIENNHAPHPSLRNRFLNNYIAETAGPLRYNDYPNTTPGSGIGMLVQNSSGQVIGEDLASPNTFRFNRIGMYLENSSGNLIQGNLITNQFIAALVVRGGEANTIGSSLPRHANEITAFGLREAGPQSGIALSFTRDNKILGNLIGHLAPGRGGYGIFINEASNNIIGGPAVKDGNTIVSNYTHGIYITGAASRMNAVFNNFIGVERNFRPAANSGDGIRLDGGAAINKIGGLANTTTPFGAAQVVAGNTIMHNTGAGVAVDGVSTISNAILYNRITANGGKGILHLNGGNRFVPAPVLQTFNGRTVTGTVDLDRLPAGSRIQVFTDPDMIEPEGDAFIAQAFVQANGTWSADVFSRAYYPIISMTATHPDGSTSEFGTGQPVITGLRIDRTDNVATATIAAGATQTAAFKLTLTAINTDAEVKTLSIDAAGSLADQTAITAAHLFDDLDRDGVVTAADRLLAGPVTFTADDGRVTFAISNRIIFPLDPAQWLVALDLSPAAPAGDLQLRVHESAAVDAVFFYPPRNSIQASGEFQIRSAQITVGAGPTGQTYANWRQRVFTVAQLNDPSISGNEADADNDGVITILEYAFNLNPLVADRNSEAGIPKAARIRIDNRDYLTISFTRWGEPSDLRYTPQAASELGAWQNVDATIAETATRDTTVDGMLLQEITLRFLQPIDALRATFVRVVVAPR